MSHLNFEKMKSDFAVFEEKMKILETRLTEKINKVDMMYEEVDAGFSRNARDRSDYLLHYERISAGTEGQLSQYKEQLSELTD